MATWTEADIATLKAAVAAGILNVTFDGPPRRSVTYADLNAMRALLAEMIADVANTAGTRKSYFFTQTKKGF